MKKILFIWFILFSFIPLFPQMQDLKVINLTLNDCILNTLENNFDIAFEALNPALNELAVRR